ncbi:MAG: hypothetical protein ACHRXM_26320 [Isosphaerales bacterium]
MAPTSTPRRLAPCLGLMATVIAISDVAAHASPIQYQYGGVITAADPSTGVAPGTRFSGTFSYDPAKLSGGFQIEGSFQAIYGRSANFPDSVADGSGLILQIGGQTVLANPGGVQVSVAEIEYPGQYGYRDTSGNLQNPHTSVSISNENVDGGPLLVALGLTNPTRSVFGSLTLPTTLNLADFSQAQLSVTLMTNPGSKTLYSGTIDSLVEIPVPEPAFATLLCLAAIVWFARTRRHPGHS